MDKIYTIILIVIILIIVVGIGIAIYEYEKNKNNNNNNNNNNSTTKPSIGDQCNSQNCVTNNECGQVTTAYCASNGFCLCGPGKGINSTCQNLNDCNYGLYCSGANTCLAPSGNLPSQVGGTCNTSSDCYVNNSCDYNKTCQNGVQSLANFPIGTINTLSLNIQNQPIFAYRGTTNQFVVAYLEFFFDTYLIFYNNNSTTIGLGNNNSQNQRTNRFVFVETNGYLSTTENIETGKDYILYVYNSASNPNSYFISDKYGNNLRYEPNPSNPYIRGLAFYDVAHYNSDIALSSWPYALFVITP